MSFSRLQKVVLSVVALAAASSVAPTQAQTTSGPKSGPRRMTVAGPRETAIPAGGTTVPLQRFQNLPHVTALVNGKGPYRFVVDTGAPLLGLNIALAEELKLFDAGGNAEKDATVVVRSPGGAGRPARACEVATLKIGDAEFRGVQALASDSPFANDFDGVLGMAVFADCLLTFDYAAGVLRLTRGELPPSDGREVLDYTLQRGKVVLATEVDGQPYDFVLDTGASLWFKFPAAVTKRSTYLHGPVEFAKARTIDQEIIVHLARLSARLQLGRHTFEHPYGVVDDGDMAVIGSGALDEFALTVDQHNRRLRLARAADGPITPPALRVLGFGMRRTSAGITVDYVLAKSPAERAGLKEGDVILALAGKPVEEIHGRPIMKELAKADSIKVRYTPANETQAREIDVPVLELMP